MQWGLNPYICILKKGQTSIHAVCSSRESCFCHWNICPNIRGKRCSRISCVSWLYRCLLIETIEAISTRCPLTDQHQPFTESLFGMTDSDDHWYALLRCGSAIGGPPVLGPEDFLIKGFEHAATTASAAIARGAMRSVICKRESRMLFVGEGVRVFSGPLGHYDDGSNHRDVGRAIGSKLVAAGMTNALEIFAGGCVSTESMVDCGLICTSFAIELLAEVWRIERWRAKGCTVYQCKFTRGHLETLEGYKVVICDIVWRNMYRVLGIGIGPLITERSSTACCDVWEIAQATWVAEFGCFRRHGQRCQDINSRPISATRRPRRCLGTWGWSAIPHAGRNCSWSTGARSPWCGYFGSAAAERRENTSDLMDFVVSDLTSTCQGVSRPCREWLPRLWGGDLHGPAEACMNGQGFLSECLLKPNRRMDREHVPRCCKAEARVGGRQCLSRATSPNIGSFFMPSLEDGELATFSSTWMSYGPPDIPQCGD